MSAWKTILRLLAAVAMLAYPIFVWLGSTTLQPRTISIALLAVATPAMALRLRGSQNANLRGLAIVPITILLILIATAVFDSPGAFLLTPVACNAVLLTVFGSTLRPGSMPMIERFARLQEKHLDADQLRWCRLWTWIWCAFFVANGTTAALLAAFASLEAWAFYNTLLAYGLIGALLLLEWLLRRRRFPQRLPPPDDGEANA